MNDQTRNNKILATYDTCLTNTLNRTCEPFREKKMMITTSSLEQDIDHSVYGAVGNMHRKFRNIIQIMVN